VYGAVPPAGVTLAVPIQVPLQNKSVFAVPADSATGCVIDTEPVATQPLPSVTVALYTPAHLPVIDAVVALSELHKYVYAGVPPVGVEVAVPSHVPLQVMFVLVKPAASTGGCVIVIVPVATQSLESVTVTVKPVAQRPVAIAVVEPVDQEYVYGDVPPAAFAFAFPVHKPKHVTFVAVGTEVSVEGSVISIVFVSVHPFESVTRTL